MTGTMQRVGDVAGWLTVAVFGTAVLGFAIWVISSVAQDMDERGSPRWTRWMVLVLTFVPPGVVWGLALWMYDERRHPAGPDGGTGWMGAVRRWANRRRDNRDSSEHAP